MHKGAKIAVGVVATAMAGAAGLGVYNVVSAVTGGSSGEAEAAPVRTGPPSSEEVDRTARDFLAAWESGDAVKAAALTDNASAAATALNGYRTAAHVEKVALKPGTATGSTVPFSVLAEVVHGTQRSTWAYDSALTVVRGRTTGQALVDWQPAVVHPQLAQNQTLTTDAVGDSQITVVDRDGTVLDGKDYPSLAPLLPGLRKRYAEKAGGEPGVEVRAVAADGNASGNASGNADGNKALGKTLHVVSKGRPAQLRTTIDAAAQRAAETAVDRRDDASVVAVKPSTGEILAFANSKKTEFNAALNGQTPPGSTMKVVTAAMLLEQGKVTPGKAVPCPKYVTYGKQFHNVEESENPSATFAQDFAASCNTAFVSLAGSVPDGALASEAKDVFGIGLDWKTGLASFDGSVPTDPDAGKAAAMIGQGRVQMSPLNMASIAATVRSGSFHQPYLVAPSLDGRTLAQAARPLPPAVAQQLRSMMRLTAVSGTGRVAMAGLDGDTGAKTGSAEIDNQPKPNGWFTAYRDDVAAAAVVPQGGHGGDSAGPIVAAVLRAAR
ncbi:penicillin-binding transpeptidase domain-containing protein [Streptomyces sp. UNOC14_S4]|uniref:penicillin-binding transpeptidase domain-containing protein n=1 Tax=Streptomyces sp. UNOC14_S4 TaxID=2872340 RepID=UPI001E656847|nr:penicillin-binding transpeptidase domain-containing protein [Streptomyces sp. UNOC14_S4]MCC3766679.1 penicillin-binding protein [Streptomyces sp. UNOC14_S4]